MPRSYSEKERAQIIGALRAAAYDSMVKNGVRKTTVDELARQARIPKGTFYLFYDSKELLLYDALMQKHAEVHAGLSGTLACLRDDRSVEAMTDAVCALYKLGFDSGLMALMMSGELEILMRKLPDETVEKHIVTDNEYLAAFRVMYPGLTDAALASYSAALRAVFCTAAYRREIGEQFDAALRLLVRGLVMQMDAENNEAKGSEVK